MNKDRLKFLLDKHHQGMLTPMEKQELDNWDAALENEDSLLEMYSEMEQFHMKEKMWDGIKAEAYQPAKIVTLPKAAQRPASLKTGVWKYAAAIAVVAVAVFYFMEVSNKEQEQIITYQAAVPATDVAAPSSSHATITLAGGQRISLKGAGTGMLAKQGDVSIRLTEDGNVVYTGTGSGQQQYNTLTVPRGSTIASIVLSDGSKVYLNAASSLTYPVAFNGNERRVQITGEAYFEVAKNRLKRFVVVSGDITTEVLGTHFNINTYPDEESAKVTLLEGSVKVSGGSTNMVIQPGDQAAIGEGKLQVNEAVDVEQVMSWKNGVFNFNNASCEMVMRQLARWYDMEIVYPQGVPNIQFGGEIQKTLSLSEMLDALGEVEVKFEIQNKKLIVLP